MAEPVNTPGAPMELYEHPAGADRIVAEARLNSEATMNALSLDMIDILMPALERWACDDRVVAVVLDSAGGRAFSAGGDIQALYRAMAHNHEVGEQVDDYPYQFFESEYRLDYRIHCFEKPIIALGHGVIMGGGLGIFSGSRFRVVTENVRIALPEVTVGLFPDAGATWFLRNIPEHHAVFVGMTGSHMNGGDARLLGLGTHSIAMDSRPTLVEKLCALPWLNSIEDDNSLIDEFLKSQKVAQLPDAQLSVVPDTLNSSLDLSAVVASIRGLAAADNPWLRRAADTMERGCPTSVGIVLEQLKRSPGLTLADCFRLEMTVATHCADNHDFTEGVRALLIDKDNQPNWQFGDLDSLPDAYVDSHFVEPWLENPLHDLEMTT